MESLDNTPSKHLQNTSDIPQNPHTKKKRKQKIHNIHNNIHSSSRTNYSHVWNTSLGQNLDETRGAVSLVVDDGSVYLFESETDHTHVWGGASGAH